MDGRRIGTLWTDEVKAMIWKYRDRPSNVIATMLTKAFGREYDGVRVSNERGKLRERNRLAQNVETAVWTKAEIDTLYREWDKGTKVSVIAAMTGKTETQVKSKRDYCKLTSRRKGRTAKAGENPLKCVHIYIDERTLTAVDAAAKDTDKSRSAYINAILEARFGFPGDVAYRRKLYRRDDPIENKTEACH